MIIILKFISKKRQLIQKPTTIHFTKEREIDTKTAIKLFNGQRKFMLFRKLVTQWLRCDSTNLHSSHKSTEKQKEGKIELN